MKQFSQKLCTILIASGSIFGIVLSVPVAAAELNGSEFFESKIRPLFVKHCYECHSEANQEQMGGLLLDRESGWTEGGEMGTAVVPGDLNSSLIIEAIRYQNEELQMPPEGKLSDREIELFEKWILLGAPGPQDDLGESEFSQLGNQAILFELGEEHWAFQPVDRPTPPQVDRNSWNQEPVDQFVLKKMTDEGIEPSDSADPRTLMRRLSLDLTGLPPTIEEIDEFIEAYRIDRTTAVKDAVDRLIESPAFGEHFARMWLDVARYADTDSFYRPDTRTAHYFPFAYTYRDYVVASFNDDKPFDQFIKEQLSADLMDFEEPAPELAALGFLTVGPHANRNQTEAIDDWIDVTTRGLMGLTVACARCHDHKYQPIPTADYYSLHGVFSSVTRIHPLDEERQPLIEGYSLNQEDCQDYAAKREEIDQKIADAGDTKSGGNNRAVATKIKETELAELMLFHPGTPVRTMIVKEKPKPVEPVIFIRGEPSIPGETVPRRFLKILDPEQPPFPANSSGRLQLAEQIASPDNPLTARVFVNRVWGALIGSYLVETPSDFGVQTSPPTHPELLDWLAADFMDHHWSLKHLVRNIALSQTYQLSSEPNARLSAIDPQNRFLWRANRKHLSIEAIHDSVLAVAANLDRTPRGHASALWGDGYTHRRAIYGYINRFNLDPTLRSFDFPSPMQSESHRLESIVAPQSLFTMNSPFVIDQAIAVTELSAVARTTDPVERITALFEVILQRHPAPEELRHIIRHLTLLEQPTTESDLSIPRSGDVWPLLAQALLMSTEFQYVD